MPITPLYSAILGLVFFVLSIRTIGVRRRLRVAVGDGRQPELLRAMRVHANFAEYVPLTLVLVYMLESLGGNAVLVHALCGGLLVGRVSHAHGVRKVVEDFRFRVFGMALTFAALIGAAVGVIGLYAWRLLA
jgi:uncharacterized membrane protein YecN with MAPEG domain